MGKYDTVSFLGGKYSLSRDYQSIEPAPFWFGDYLNYLLTKLQMVRMAIP